MKVMLFGDSHLAAVRRGLAAIPPARLDGVELQFWGTPGNRFRHIDWQDGRITPLEEATANAFARCNAVVFVGARIRPGAVVPDLLNHIADPDRYLTRAYIKAVIAAQFRRLSTYRMAQAMAAAGKTRVLLNPISLSTHRAGAAPRPYAMARRASRADIALLWSAMAEVLAEDGIGAILQPQDTVVAGYLTDERYGLPPGDDAHKNAEYGALILEAILQAVQRPAGSADQ